MSWLGNVLGFESFNLKDMLGKVKSHPQQLLLGAADPIGAKMWNGLLGTKYEPIVDQMGGAYGGHTFSAFGNKDGGVYQRAQNAGINTTAGGQAQDASHIISALIAGGKMFGGGNGSGNSGGGNGWSNLNRIPTSSQNDTQESQPLDAAAQFDEYRRREKIRQLVAAMNNRQAMV